ncbi:uncharacterized protein L201_006620 [Kwoniella dendrophila CBS 6074]|uniref:VHS domain-containing protein n=1 Tax=Kwoniella dendrophila CBS 6074 TaxID=1295534 RepID=A0AAX4K3J5_9TREE
MSHAGGYFKTAMSIVNRLEEGKPHSSITDWVEVLTSDRYDELSLDGIPELVESINIQGYQGTAEGTRAIRKKLKYGNVHRQLRALVILRALTENAGKGFQLGWANQQLMDRLREMANDSLLDPKVKKRLVLVFHAWSIHYKDEPRMQEVARLYAKYGGAGPGVKKPTPMAPHKQSSVSSSISATSASSGGNRGGFDDDLFSHDWAPSKGNRGPDTYTDLAAAKADADARKRDREARILIEQREAEVERREREFKRKQDMAALEARRQREAAEEAERRRQAKEDAKKRGPNVKPQPKRPPFDFQKEKPQMMVSIANAIQCANNLVNSCRLIDRSVESVLESPKVQDNLDKAKAARRSVIRYIQLVTDEEFVGTLLEANEKIVEAIQLYDRLSKPSVLDSDSDEEVKETEALAKRLAAQKLEAQRTGEIDQLQSRQKKESARRELKRQQSAKQVPPARPSRQTSSAHPDLADLDFGSISATKDKGRGLPQPMKPDSDEDSYRQGLSDYSDSDYNYDSSDDGYRSRHQSRNPSRRQSLAGPSGGHGQRQPPARAYESLEDNYPQQQYGRKGLLDESDDPFADDIETPTHERKECK